MKKISSLLFSLVLVFSLLLGQSSIAAEQTLNKYEDNIITDDEILLNELSKIKEDSPKLRELKKILSKKNKSARAKAALPEDVQLASHNVLVLTDGLATSSISSKSKTAEANALVANAATVNIVYLDYYIYTSVSLNKAYQKVTYTGYIGDTPSSVRITNHLQTATSRYGSYSGVGGQSATFTTLNQSNTLDVSTRTAYWRGFVEGTSYYNGVFGNYSTGTTPVQLFNKKGFIYPVYTDSFSGKTINEPASTAWTQVPESQRVTWDNTKRGAFITNYINTYGDPGWNWADYDIHHIRPREYGGDNSFYNLIPLPRSYHQQTVTPWWVNY